MKRESNMRYVTAFAWSKGHFGEWEVLDTQDNCKVVFSRKDLAEAIAKRNDLNEDAAKARSDGEVAV